MCLRESCTRETRTRSLGGGRRPARKRASSDPTGSVKTLALPPRSPNLNAYAERWVRSVKEECLAKLILLGEGSLRRALRHYEAHYHEERNHQGKNNVLLFPLPTQAVRGEQEKVRCRERLGGLLKYYEREAADRKSTRLNSSHPSISYAVFCLKK